LNRAKEDTVGAGVYLADAPTARAYALHRSGAAGTPVVYGVDIQRARLVNLTDHDTVTKVMTGFREVLMRELLQAIDADAPWYRVNGLSQLIEYLDNGRGSQVGTIKYVTERSGTLFTRYLQGQGFDGVVAVEGGGGRIPTHYSYVVFDPATVRIISQDTVAVTDDPGASSRSSHDRAGEHSVDGGQPSGETARGPATLLEAAFPRDRGTQRGEPDTTYRALPDAGPYTVAENDTGL